MKKGVEIGYVYEASLHKFQAKYMACQVITVGVYPGWALKDMQYFYRVFIG
jgi:hypothetical protein